MNKFVNYVKETKVELKHVSWPTKRQATMLTIAVIAISLLIAAYLGAFDFILIRVLQFTF